MAPPSKAVRKKVVAGKTLEEVMPLLRRGKAVRRRGWHCESRIFKLGPDVFVKIPDSYARPPQTWRPYPNDILAADWEKA